jgi:hypothetical protein
MLLLTARMVSGMLRVTTARLKAASATKRRVGVLNNVFLVT